MKILNVMFTNRLGGLEQSFLDYSSALLSQGAEVISIVHSKTPLKFPLDSKIRKIGNFSKHDPIALLRLWYLVKKEQPDLIITHGNRAHYMMKKVSGNVPVVGVSHVYSFDYIIDCDYIIVVSRDMIPPLVDCGYKADKIFHVPNMISIPSDCRYIPYQPHKVPVIGVIGRIEKIKGIDIFIKALASLKEKNIPFKAKIAGSGPEYNDIKNLIAELKLEQEIELLGWTNDKEKFYNNIDILCVPSLSEAFGIVILEGLMFSKPIIVSDLPGPREIVVNEKTALVVTSGSVVELALAIERLLKNTDLAQDLAKEGFYKVMDYDMKMIGKRLMKLCRGFRKP